MSDLYLLIRSAGHRLHSIVSVHESLPAAEMWANAYISGAYRPELDARELTIVEAPTGRPLDNLARRYRTSATSAAHNQPWRQI